MKRLMNAIDISKTYKEVYVILNKLDLLKLIPDKTVALLKNNMDQDYNFDISTSIPLEEQKISVDTKTFISYLYLKYINKNIKERKYLENIYYKNEERRLNEIKSKNIFDNPNSSVDENIQKEEKSLVVAKKDTLLQKIINKIKKLLKK